ncbi:MAG: hypothetical protein KIT42_01800 [Rhodocyclaceae bacterium]|nr:hypothetical protein [Rhodocyclaceae bacterium]
MSRSAFTIKAFGIYLIVMSAGLIVAPNRVLTLFGIVAGTEIWIRIVGMAVFNIGVFYWYAAHCEAVAIFRVSVYTRILILLAFCAFAALGLASPILILFGAAEFAGAVWTRYALKSENQDSTLGAIPTNAVH